MTTAPITQDFDTAWRDTFTRHRDLFSVLSALIAATDAGAHPVALEHLAQLLDRSVPDTERLVTGVAQGARAWANTRLDDGLAQFDFVAMKGTPRFRYHIGGRTVGVGGCAPDIFLVAFALRQPFQVESVCPVTGTPIRVEFDTDGVAAAEPAGTVVAMIHPHTAPEAFMLTDPDKIDAGICLHQPFFASTDAAAGWLGTHPGGKVFPVAHFYRHLDQLMARV